MTDAPAYDAEVRHAVYVERYKAQTARRIVAMVNDVSNDLFARITEGDLDGMNRRQLSKLLRDVERIVKRGYGPIDADLVETFRAFGVYEAEWQSGMLERVGIVSNLGVPSDADLWAAANARPFEGKLLSDWIAGLSASTQRRVQEAITQGFTDGLSPLEIARQIRGTRSRKGIMDISKRGAEAMARTAINHTASAAKGETFRRNRAIKQVQWVSVLDGRTSPMCRANDGKIFPKNEGPRPPIHVGCRSTIVAVTNANRQRLSERPTYNDWLSGQSKDVQDDILGPSRGALYREGNYPVDRFVDKTGQTYTLDQLRAKDQGTFDDLFGE